MLRFLLALTTLALLSACDSETTVKQPPATGTGTGSSDGGVDGNDGGDGGNTDGNPNIQNVVCDSPDASKDTGKGVPFQSFTYTVKDIAGGEGKSCPDTSNIGQTYNFTCTMCPGGFANVNGRFKFYDEPDVTTPDPKVTRETITFDGNSFENIIEHTDAADGKKKTIKAKGYYFCPLPDEVQNMKYNDYFTTVLVYTEADPPGAFGIQPGSADLTFLAVSAANLEGPANDIIMQLNSCWDSKGSKQNEYQYCKIGEKVHGTVCPDPFKE